jgi:hypothetical protein
MEKNKLSGLKKSKIFSPVLTSVADTNWRFA